MQAKIRQWRRRLSLTQAAGAQEIGVSESTIRNYESGRTEPGLTERLAMAAVEHRLRPVGAPSASAEMANVLKHFDSKLDPSMADAQKESGASTADASKKKKPVVVDAPNKKKKPVAADASKKKKPVTLNAQQNSDGKWAVD